MKLQWLLSTGFFGNGYRPDMILSVTTSTPHLSACPHLPDIVSVSSPFRGTQLVYSLGEDVRNAPDVRPLSAGDLLAKGVHVLSYLAPLLPRALDLHADARALSFRDVSLRSLLGQLWKSDWAESRDATPFDATFQAAEEREDAGEGAPHPRTYYRSYCATLVRSVSPGGPSVRAWATLTSADFVTGQGGRAGHRRGEFSSAEGVCVAAVSLVAGYGGVRFCDVATNAVHPEGHPCNASRAQWKRAIHGGGHHRRGRDQERASVGAASERRRRAAVLAMASFRVRVSAVPRPPYQRS